MLELGHKCQVFDRIGVVAQGKIVGRTHESNPRYDIMTLKNEILLNIPGNKIRKDSTQTIERLKDEYNGILAGVISGDENEVAEKIRLLVGEDEWK